MLTNSPDGCRWMVVSGITGWVAVGFRSLSCPGRWRLVLPGEQQLLIYGSFTRGCFTRPIDGGPRARDRWCNCMDRRAVDNHHVVIVCVLFPFLGPFRGDLRVLRDDVVGLARISGKVIEGALPGSTHRLWGGDQLPFS